MNREIKFRAKDMSGEWVYGDIIHKRTAPGEAMIRCKQGIESDVDVETIGQYTGLKDKNDKEIYEGDILYAVNLRIPPFYQNGTLYKGMGGKFEVVYVGCGFYLKNKDGHCINFLSDWEYEVIGNIYDNPELVEG